MNLRQRQLASIIKFRAKVEGISPREAAAMIIENYGGGEEGLIDWATRKGLTLNQILQVLYHLDEPKDPDVQS